jgi:hypothetical protein
LHSGWSRRGKTQQPSDGNYQRSAAFLHIDPWLSILRAEPATSGPAELARLPIPDGRSDEPLSSTKSPAVFISPIRQFGPITITKSSCRGLPYPWFSRPALFRPGRASPTLTGYFHPRWRPERNLFIRRIALLENGSRLARICLHYPFTGPSRAGSIRCLLFP